MVFRNGASLCKIDAMLKTGYIVYTDYLIVFKENVCIYKAFVYAILYM